MITAQLEKEFGIERARTDAKAEADLKSERQQSAVREARAMRLKKLARNSSGKSSRKRSKLAPTW